MKLLLIFIVVLAQGQWIAQYKAFHGNKITDLDGWVIQNQYKATTDIIRKCGEIPIVGGHETFGLRSTMTKMIKIPPHYKLKFNIQFWKIGTWEAEKIQVYVDGVPWEQNWGFSEGGVQLCGGPQSKSSDKVYDVEFEIPHNSPQAIIVIASTQAKDADQQAWGIRQILIQYLPCPFECGICHNDKVAECQAWSQAQLSWFKTDVAAEGWNVANGKAKAFMCSGVVIFGGYENIGQKSVISRQFQGLPPHVKLMIKLQFWKIDFWDNEEFTIKIDGKVEYKKAFQKTDGVDLCGADETKPGFGEKIQNVEIILKHNKPDINIEMTSSLRLETTEQSWGVRDFFMFVEQCTKFCDSCTGSLVNECTKCQASRELKDGKCTNAVDWYIVHQDFFEKKDFVNVNTWQIIDPEPNTPNPPVTNCGETNIVGGYKLFGRKTIAQKVYDIPDHQRVRIQLEVYKVDFWDGEDLTVTADDKVIFQQSLGWNDPGQSNECGDSASNWRDRIIKIDEIIEHTNPKLTLKITSTLQKGAIVASWGYRGVQILYQPDVKCIEVYSECNFKGRMIKLCQHADSFKDVKIDFDIKSVKIPDGLKLTGYKNSQFKGDKLVYETNQECIKEYEFSFLQNNNQLSYNIRRH